MKRELLRLEVLFILLILERQISSRCRLRNCDTDVQISKFCVLVKLFIN